MPTFETSAGPFKSPSLNIPGIPAAWGDLAETSEPMKGNLFATVIEVPTNLRAALSTAKIPSGIVLSMLTSGVVLPQEAVITEEVQTKLSSYDIVVGKERGELSLTFMEQMGAPVSSIMSTWHNQIVDARNNGIGFTKDFATRVWVAALAGNGSPFYWWMFTRCFPKVRGNNPTFGNEQKSKVDIEVPFSYLEMKDGVEALVGVGASFATNLQSAARAIGLGSV